MEDRDTTTEGVPNSTATKKRRPLFERRVPVTKPDTIEDQGIEFFSRAKDLFPARILEDFQEREKKKYAEANEESEQARDRSRLSGSHSVERDRESSLDTSSKRQRISEDADTKRTDSFANPRETSFIEETHYPTPGSPDSHTTGAISKSRDKTVGLTDRYTESLTRADRKVPEVPVVPISLDSDDEDFKTVRNRESEVYFVAERDNDKSEYDNRRSATQEQDDLVIIDGEEEEEFPELIAAARERAKQEEIQRAKSKETFLQKNREQEQDLFEMETQILDPILDIFITSRIKDTKPLLVKRRYRQKLREVRLEWCRKQSIDGQSLSEEDVAKIFFTWKMKKQFDISSCAEIGLKLDANGKILGEDGDTQGKVHLEAWTEEIFQAHKQFLAQQAEAEANRVLAPESNTDKPAVKKLKLSFRSREYEIFKLAVPASTTFAKIIAAFAAKNDVPEDKVITIEWEGETMALDQTVEDAELQDKDIVDVHVR